MGEVAFKWQFMFLGQMMTVHSGLATFDEVY